MGRETARQIETNPNLTHVDVQRNSAGTVQMTGTATTTGLTANQSGTTTPFTTVLDQPPHVAFTSAKVVVKGGGAGNTGTAKLLRNGTTTVASTSSTGTSTTSVSNTHASVLNAPTYSVQIVNAGGTVTATLTLSREQRWSG